ncbi:hypothetical protein ACLMJK_009494 [Lecanora helva]
MEEERFDPQLCDVEPPLESSAELTKIYHQKPFRYLDLPSEVRNMIMGYVLNPGDVYVRPLTRPRPEQAGPWDTLTEECALPLFPLKYSWLPPYNSFDKEFCKLVGDEPLPKASVKPGFQLLAASKQTLAEGHRMFYEDNIFHLPHGPLETIDEWLKNIQPAHKAMIKRVSITFSLADMPPRRLAHLDYFETENGDIPLEKRNGDPGDYDYLTWRVMDWLHFVWLYKLYFLRKWKSLEEIYIRCGDHTLKFDASDPELFDKMHREGFCRFVKDVKHELSAMLQAEGWDHTRNWMLRRGKLIYGQRYFDRYDIEESQCEDQEEKDQEEILMASHAFMLGP